LNLQSSLLFLLKNGFTAIAAHWSLLRTTSNLATQTRSTSQVGLVDELSHNLYFCQQLMARAVGSRVDSCYLNSTYSPASLAAANGLAVDIMLFCTSDYIY
jgi:hypothetical protein